jgi:cell shape-determining protein MreC
MTQFQFDVLCKVIENGAPALANELCSAVSNLVQSYNKLAEENERLKAEPEESKAE